MARRIDLGRVVLILGSALLFISLFLKWYDTGPTGWQVFEALDLVLAGLAVAGVAAALRPDLTPPWAAWGVPGAAVVIVVVQLVNVPPAAGSGAPTDGAWLALGGSVLMAAGAALSLATISITLSVRDHEPRRRLAAVDRRPEHVGADGDEPEAEPDPIAPPADELERTQPLTALEEPSEGPRRGR
jgi:peptidoglycan/LPS O-acetylase OafA/YrhL